MHRATNAACNALISLERLAALPDMHRFPGFEAELEQARATLRGAVRELRLAGTARPSVQELDFVVAHRRGRRHAGD